MSGTPDVAGKVAWQGDLSKVYLDPYRPPKGWVTLLAYVPEQHASPNCRRALSGGTEKATADRRGPWCDVCTTPVKGAATVRRTITGWRAA